MVPILMEGLRRLEYRGYDSAGLAVLTATATSAAAHRRQGQRCAGARRAPTAGGTSASRHTRWATHGVPSERNAHPHMSRDGIAIVHNGIIENHEALRAELSELGYQFTSETDTEVIAHRIHHHLASSRGPVRGRAPTVARTARRLCARGDPRERSRTASCSRAPAARSSIGLGIDENFVASDVAALLPVTRRFMFLEEGDVAEIRRTGVRIVDARRHAGRAARCARANCRPTRSSAASTGISCSRRSTSSRARSRRRSRSASPAASCSRRRSVPRRSDGVRSARGRADRRLRHQLPRRPGGLLFHRADLPASRARIEIASEYRYRNPRRAEDTLFVTISQSGETADTLAALRIAKQARLPVDAGDLQRRRELDGARIGARAADARRARDRRRLDQGLHDPAGRARHAGHRARQAPRRRRASASAASSRGCIEIPRLVERDAEARPGRSSVLAETLRRQAPRAVPRPRRAARRSRWKAR